MSNDLFNILVYGSNSARIRQLFNTIEYDQGKRSLTWYSNAVKNVAFKLNSTDRIIRFSIVEDIDQVDDVSKELKEIHAGIVLFDAREDAAKEQTEARIKKLSEYDKLKEILVLITNAAKKKNDEGILSRRQAKYFITGLSGDYDVELEYNEIKPDHDEDDKTEIWNFVENLLN